ncbi:MAG: hypothetical protein AAGA81_16440 [Acidobacteriota bacterium]
MLRASGQAHDEKYELSAIVDGSDGDDSGVPHSALLVRLAEALVGRDEEALARIRREILEAMGAEQLVDSMAVAANFQRMVRIADGTGIPLDSAALQVTEDLRSELGLDHFEGARNSPKLGFFGRATAFLMRGAFRRMAKRSRA